MDDQISAHEDLDSFSFITSHQNGELIAPVKQVSPRENIFYSLFKEEP